MKASECLPGDQIYTHHHPETGYTHINPNAIIRAIVAKQIEFAVFKLPLKQDLYEHIAQKGGIERHHVERTKREWALRGNTPLLYIEWEEEQHSLIDGSHRLVAAYEMGIRSLIAAMVKPAAWRQFIIVPDTIEAMMVLKLSAQRTDEAVIENTEAFQKQ